MAIAIVRFEHENQAQWGVANAGQIYPLSFNPSSLAELLAQDLSQVKPADRHLPEDSVRLLSPITSPCQIFCQGLNYADHAREIGIAPGQLKHNTIFVKSSASLCGARDAIQRPPHVELLDYEIELGLVIGKPMLRALPLDFSDWRSYIAGLVIANDVSARDVQLREGQWVKAKSYRTFCPAGPYFLWLEPDDFEHVYDLELELTVNGEVRQRSNTEHQIYRASETLRELSQIADLYPGDLVLTGTPGGVALQAPRPLVQRLARLLLPEALGLELFLRKQKHSPRFLQEGDVIKARIWNERLDLGVQSTRVGE